MSLLANPSVESSIDRTPIELSIPSAPTVVVRTGTLLYTASTVLPLTPAPKFKGIIATLTDE